MAIINILLALGISAILAIIIKISLIIKELYKYDKNDNEIDKGEK